MAIGVNHRIADFTTLFFLNSDSLQGNKTQLPKILEELFKEIDNGDEGNGDGKLQAEELVILEKSLNRTISVEQAQEIINQWDCTGKIKLFSQGHTDLIEKPF